MVYFSKYGRTKMKKKEGLSEVLEIPTCGPPCGNATYNAHLMPEIATWSCSRGETRGSQSVNRRAKMQRNTCTVAQNAGQTFGAATGPTGHGGVF